MMIYAVIRDYSFFIDRITSRLASINILYVKVFQAFALNNSLVDDKMNNKEIKELRDRIVRGVTLAHRELINRKIKLGQRIIISENGVIKEIDPIELKSN